MATNHRNRGFSMQSAQRRQENPYQQDATVVSPRLIPLYTGDGAELAEGLSRMSSQSFLNALLRQSAHPGNKTARHGERQKVLKNVHCAESPTQDIKMVAFDVDQTMGLLYPISSTTGAWAIAHIAKANDLDAKKLYAVARTVAPEYLCHSETAFLDQLAEKSGHAALSPANPKNAPYLDAWHKMRDTLNVSWVFRDIRPGIERIKKDGGLVYIVTNAPRASVLHRMYLWLGRKGADLLDGVAVRDDLPGLASTNPRASDDEKRFVETLEAREKIVVVPCSLIKPDGYHLNWAYEHANSNGPTGNQIILPREVIMIGDSFGSDGGTARNLSVFAGEEAQFVLTVKGLTIDPLVRKCHDHVGHECDPLGVEAVLEKARNPKYNKPVLAVERFGEVLDNFNIVPAYPSRRSRAVVRAKIGNGSV